MRKETLGWLFFCIFQVTVAAVFFLIGSVVEQRVATKKHVECLYKLGDMHGMLDVCEIALNACSEKE